MGRFWNGESGLGKSFEFGRTVTGDNVVEIVGVVKDAKYYRLKEDAPATVYLPLRQSLNNLGAMHVEVRTAGDPKALIPAVRRAVESLDNRLPLFSVKTQAEQIDQLLYQERLFAKLISFFGLLALSLACVGLYGILSYAVARRTGEIRLRMALGAQGSNIVSMVLRETLLLVAIGLALGVPAALAAAQSASGVISGLLFGLGPSDAGTLALAPFVMAAAAAIAGLLLPRRASRVDPMVALRRE